jgi:CheY-like chemotaxis protein
MIAVTPQMPMLLQENFTVRLLELLRQGEIDVAILDVNVGGRRSFPVADILKSRGLPFAFASGYGEAGIIEAYRGAPVLQKPFLQSDLEKALLGLRSALIPSSPD